VLKQIDFSAFVPRYKFLIERIAAHFPQRFCILFCIPLVAIELGLAQDRNVDLLRYKLFETLC